MSKFNKQPVTGKFTTPKTNLRPILNKPIQQTVLPESKKNLKDTVRQIIEQIKEQKQNANPKTFKHVVDMMMKNKSRVKNENVLKLANSIILSQHKISNDNIPNIQDPTPNIQPIPNIPLPEHQVIDSIIYPAFETFSQENPMSLTVHSNINKLRFGSALLNKSI